MNKNIFRAYDIRGIYNSELFDNDAYKLGRAIGTILKRRGDSKTVVGYDNRASSVDLLNNLVRGLNESGVDVFNIGFCTTPMLYFSWNFLNINSGIMITASHNPKEYNGFKISLNGRYSIAGEAIQDLRLFTENSSFEIGSGICENIDIKNNYIDYLVKNISIKNRIKVVFDVGNGSVSSIINDVLNKLNIEVVPLFFDSDPNFPNHHPDPSVTENLKHLQDKVIKTNSICGFAFDGDGDRIGMVDELGNIIEADKIMIILTKYISSTLDDKRVLYDVKCTKALEEEIIKIKGIPIESRTGNSFLRRRIVEDNIKLAGEFSGHIFINDKFSGFDDAIYVALRIIEIITSNNLKCSQLLDDVNPYFQTEEIKITVSDELKFETIDKIKKLLVSEGIYFSELDGVKITDSDGFVLIRASNTGPTLIVRIEDKNESNLKIKRNYWISKITSIVNGEK